MTSRLLSCLCVLLALLGAAEAGGSPVQAAAPDEIDLKALQTIEGVVQLFRQFPDSIWPGFNLADRPFIVYRPGRWALLAGYIANVDGFGAYPVSWPDLGHPVRFYPGEHETLRGQLFFDFPLGDTTAVAIGLPENMPVSPQFEGAAYEASALGFIVHESFHQYQYDAFGEIPWEREERYPILDRHNTALAALEMRLLTNAVAAARGYDYDELVRQVRMYLAVRDERWSTSPPFVARFEQGLELLEGTAKYVEVSAVGMVGDLTYHSDVPSYSPLPEKLAGATPEGLVIADLEEGLRGGSVPPEDMPRNRVYAVGAAEGLLLDCLSIDWKEEAQLAGSQFTMSSALKAGLSVGEMDRALLVSEAGETGGLEAIIASTDALIADYVAGYEAERAAFESLKGLRVSVSMPRSGLARSRVTNERKWTTDEGSVQLCSDYDLYTLSSEDILLMLKNAAVLEENDWDAGLRTVTAIAPGEPKLVLDGEPAALEPGARRYFDSIELSAGDFDLRASLPGVAIYSREGALTIDLTGE